MSYTIKDVAKLAHVSTATASLVINGKPGVRPETKARILAAVKQLNYTPNASARNLIRQRSDMLGLVVTELSNPFFGMLASEISKFAAQKGYHLSIGISNNKISQEAACVARFTQERAEGVIVTPSYMTDYDLQHLYQLKSAGIPLVFTSTRYVGIKADCVMCDIKKGEYLLTKHLLLTGHRRIYLMGGPKTAMFAYERFAGYRQAYEEAGLSYHESWLIEADPDFQGGYEATQKILTDRPDAITAINDLTAMGILKCLKDHNVRVPDDISVAGYDDLVYSSMLETPLTTVRQPIADIAQKTVEVLCRQINGPGTEEKDYYIDPLLKLRDTTK